MISLAQQQPSTVASFQSTKIPSNVKICDKVEEDCVEFGKKHVKYKYVDGKKTSSSRGIRPNSQFLSRLIGQIERTNENVPVAASLIPCEGKYQDKHAVISDLKG
jgi:hypothetical protein